MTLTATSSHGPITEQPSVAVVIPVYNGEAYLEECLRSVFAQTSPAQEIVVVDDGSTDRSAFIARSFTGVTVLQQANSGVAASRNAGVRATVAPWIAFLDADDVWLPEKLATQLATIRDTSADVCFAGWRLLYPVGSSPQFVPGEEVMAPCSHEIAKQLQTGRSFTPSCALVRRQMFDKTAGFLPEAAPAEDWDLWLQLADLGAVFAACRTPLILYRTHPANASSQGERMYKASMGTFERRLAPAIHPLFRPLRRATLRSNFLAAHARVNRVQGQPHLRLMAFSIALSPFGQWNRYLALLHMLLTGLRLLPQPGRGYGR